MVDKAILQKCVAILDKRKEGDKELRKAWTGEASSIVSANLQIIRRLKVEILARKRETRRERRPGAEPRNPKSEPWSVSDLWESYKTKDWAGYSWEKVDEFWERCSRCGGSGLETCSSCGGSGRKACSSCDGKGEITAYE